MRALIYDENMTHEYGKCSHVEGKLAAGFAVREIEPADLLLTHAGRLGTAVRSAGFTVVGLS